MRSTLGRWRSKTRSTLFPLTAQITRRDCKISPLARIHDPKLMQFGSGVIVWAHADLWAFSEAADGGPAIILGDRADIRMFALLHPGYRGRLVVGADSAIGHGTFIGAQGGVTLGSKVMIGPNCSLLSGEHGLALGDVPMADQEHRDVPIVLEDNVYLGANVVVQGGVTIGRGAIVGSGAVVRRDVAAGDIVGGVPAKVIRSAAQRANV